MVLTAGGPCVGQEKRRRHEGDDEADQFCGAVTSHTICKLPGHIETPKRLKAQCEAASSSPMSMPDDKKLLAIERIFDCRCAAAPPARAHNALSRVCGMAPQMLQPRRQGRGRYGERMHHGGGHVRERRLFGAGTLQAQGR